VPLPHLFVKEGIHLDINLDPTTNLGLDEFCLSHLPHLWPGLEPWAALGRGVLFPHLCVERKLGSTYYFPHLSGVSSLVYSTTYMCRGMCICVESRRRVSYYLRPILWGVTNRS